MDVSPRVQVAAIDDQATSDGVVLDLQHLDSQVTGK